MSGTAKARIDAPPAEPCEIEALYARHGDFVHALVARLVGSGGDADDVTQEVFVLAWRKIASFHGGSARAWLTQIAVKRAAAARRRSWVRHLLKLPTMADPVDARTPERLAAAREGSDRVQAVLEQLTEKKRTVFILFEVEGFSGQEIAEILGCPLQTVHTRLYHARREFVALFNAAEAASAGRGDRRD